MLSYLLQQHFDVVGHIDDLDQALPVAVESSVPVAENFIRNLLDFVLFSTIIFDEVFSLDQI